MENLTIRVTKEQKEKMRENARLMGMTLSTFIRYIATRTPKG